MGSHPVRAHGERNRRGRTRRGGNDAGNQLRSFEWTLFEQPGSTVCPMAPVARITAGDGAQIRFEGRGYTTRPSQSGPSWRVAATLYFATV